MDSAADNPVPMSTAGRALQAGWTKLRELWRTQRTHRSLRVKETAALGERRFVAVVQFERQRFLVGASSASVTLLAHLPEAEADGKESE